MASRFKANEKNAEVWIGYDQQTQVNEQYRRSIWNRCKRRNYGNEAAANVAILPARALTEPFPSGCTRLLKKMTKNC